MPPPKATDAALMLEEPLIRTPYELMRRSHRAAQRHVERDFTQVQTMLSGLLKSLEADTTPEQRESALGKLDQAGEKVRGLKRKLDDLQPNEIVPTALRSRLTYLDQLSKPPGDAPKGGVSSGAEKEGDNTFDRYIVDYLLRAGRIKTARAMAAAKGIEELVDIKLFAELIKIETALVEKHSVAEALAWCGENRGTLKKTKNDIEFVLRMQDFIELCRKREVTTAIAYARKNLAPWASSHMNEIQQLMALLSFGEKTDVKLYRHLYKQEQWQFVQREFRRTFLTLYALPGQSLLSLALSAGLSTLRLPSCARYQRPDPSSPKSPTIPLLPAAPPMHTTFGDFIMDPPLSPGFPRTMSRVEPKEEEVTGNVDCPTCAPDMVVLANEVPMSHHVNSTLVCRISGKVMDSSDPPMAFPNGYVYSYSALKDMALGNFNVVTCPRTRESCSFDRLRKVYIS